MTTVSTASGSKPAARNAANAASWWSIAAGPVRRNASDAPHGSTTRVWPADSTIQNACPTRTSLGEAHQRPTAQPSAATSASVSATASGGRVTSKYGDPGEAHVTDVESLDLRHSVILPSRAVAGVGIRGAD